MTIGSSLILIATGAILRYAVTEHVAGMNLRAAGVILMIAGAAGVVVALVTSLRGRDFGARPGGF